MSSASTISPHRPASAATPAGGGPSPYLRQHVAEIEAPVIDSRTFRPAWRRVPRLDKLLHSEVITAREWQRAQEFRMLYERAHRGELAVKDVATHVYLDPNCRRHGSDEPSQRRLEAVERLRRVRGELGKAAFGLIVMLVDEDAGWAAIGKRFRIDPKTARRWTLVALQGFAGIR
jgi:hypothetical protein